MSLSRQVVGGELDHVRKDEAMGFNRVFPDPAFGVLSYEATRRRRNVAGPPWSRRGEVFHGGL